MKKVKKIIIYLILPALLIISGGGMYVYIKRTGPYYVPDIALTTYEGQSFSLRSLHGKPALVIFWASTCGKCISELPHLINLHNDYSEKGLEIVGIVIYYNDKNDAYAMVQDRDIPYRILLDEDKQATNAFRNVHFTPTTFLIAPNGRIVYRQQGVIDFELITKRIREWLNAE